MQILINEPIKQEDLVIYPVWKDDNGVIIPKNLDSQVPESMKDIIHLMDKEQFFLFEANGHKSVLLIMGKEKSFVDALSTMRKFLVQQKKMATKGACIVLNYEGVNIDSSVVEAIINGAHWSSQPMKVKQDKDEQEGINHCNFLVDLSDQSIVQKAIHISEGQILAANLVNLPANIKTPGYMATQLRELSKYSSVKVTIFEDEELEENGLHAVFAVGKASENRPHFAIAEYTPDKYSKTLGIIGKGVTFDTGGISIKPSSNLHFMKCDMGGAAAVIGALHSIVSLSLPIKVVAIIPTVENAVAGNALKPGDIIDSYSGKTIEIIDTDAEGRLILADALAYMTRNYQPDVIIDLATLTGSSVATLGYEAAALFSDNEDLIQDLTQLGDQYGERTWRLPLWDAYKGDLHSDIADVRNYSGKPVAGAITAAKFLQVFTNDHPAWAHLDIAGVAFKESEFGKMKNGTGYGVRLITAFAENLISENPVTS
jgi:leucyl aminopeptidase